MSLLPGASIGSYVAVAPIGAGGMGEVHRARDSRLDRDVAIKIGPAAPTRSGSRVWQGVAVLFAVTTTAGFAAWYRAIKPPVVARFLIAPPEKMAFTAGGRTYATVPAISPDGRTVAFTAQDAEGKRLLWLRPIDAVEAQPMPGTEGASSPFWSPYFMGGGKLWAVAVTAEGDAFVAGPPTPLFNHSGVGNTTHSSYFSYAVANDGQRFLLGRAPSGTEAVARSSPIVVILNWLGGANK